MRIVSPRTAIERRALWMAEDAARVLTTLPLEDALQLVHLYAERRSPKYEKVALRWLERYLTESSPGLQHFAETARDLAKRAGGINLHSDAIRRRGSVLACPALEQLGRLARLRLIRDDDPRPSGI